MDIIRKRRGKCLAIKIDDDIRNQIKSFKDRLLEMYMYDDLSDLDKMTINVILNDLDEYDRNILIAFYAVANQSTTQLGKILGVTSPAVHYQLKKIRANVRNRVDNVTANSGVSN